jgi:hypothetical protein
MAITAELKNFLELIGPKESVIGALFFVGIAILLHSLLFGPDLTHIPLARDDLSSRQRLKQYTHNAKALHREAYKKVHPDCYFTRGGID